MNNAAYLALDLQFCLCLRSDAGASVGTGVLSFRSDHIKGFFQKNERYILKYEYLGKAKHASRGYRFITKDLFDFFKKPSILIIFINILGQYCLRCDISM